MKASVFDQRHYPTLSIQEGYTASAATYDEMKAGSLMDYPLLEHIQTVAWEQLEAVADLACGTGRTGVWLKEHGVHFLDGVDLTEAMLQQAHAKGIYRSLSLADLRQTPFSAHSYDLVSVGLADDHLPELVPLYQEAARLVRPQGYLVLLGYHPFFQLSGIPTTFEQPTGELITIEGYVHLFSEHVQAASACGWLLRELYERLIDEAWIAQRPRAAQGLARQLRLSLAAAVLACPQAEEGREGVWHAEQGDRRPGLARGTGVASESLIPGETSMGTLRTRKRCKSDGRGSRVSRPHLDLDALRTKQLYARASMGSTAPVLPKERFFPNGERMQENTHLTRLRGGVAIPLALLT